LFFSKTKSQITLENIYTDTSINFGIINLESSGKKYFSLNGIVVNMGYKTFELKLYNLDHSLFKTTVVDISLLLDTSSWDSYNVEGPFYITENLFDLDNEIEFMIEYCGSADGLGQCGIGVVNEDGSILLNSDVNYSFNRYIIENTSAGTKLIINNNVYSLPGRLPCSRPCSDSTITGKKISQNRGLTSDVKAYPNPTKDYINIEYELPNGARKGDIVFYDFQGREIKRYTVDRTFDYLKLKTDDLPKGMYIFNLQTAKGVSQSKKILKIE
jgi:hypothetical protein